MHSEYELEDESGYTSNQDTMLSLNLNFKFPVVKETLPERTVKQLQAELKIMRLRCVQARTMENETSSHFPNQTQYDDEQAQDMSVTTSTDVDEILFEIPSLEFHAGVSHLSISGYPPTSTTDRQGSIALDKYEKLEAENTETRLLSLPKEVRVGIYEMVLVEDKKVMVCFDDYASVPSLPGLMSVSRQVRKETQPIFYGKNRFQGARTHLARDDAPKMLRELHSDTKSLIKHFEMATFSVLSVECVMSLAGMKVKELHVTEAEDGLSWAVFEGI